MFHQEEMSIPYHFLLNIVKAICSLICAFLCDGRLILWLNILKTINVYPCLFNEHRFMVNVLNDSAHSIALTLFSWQRRKQFNLEITRIISNVKIYLRKKQYLINNKNIISNYPSLLLPRQTILWYSKHFQSKYAVYKYTFTLISSTASRK